MLATASNYFFSVRIQLNCDEKDKEEEKNILCKVLILN